MNEAFFIGIIGILFLFATIFLWFLFGYGRTTDSTGKQLSDAEKSVDRAGKGIDRAERTVDEVTESVAGAKSTTGRIENGNRTMQEVVADSERILEEIRHQAVDN